MELTKLKAMAKTTMTKKKKGQWRTAGMPILRSRTTRPRTTEAKISLKKLPTMVLLTMRTPGKKTKGGGGYLEGGGGEHHACR